MVRTPDTVHQEIIDNMLSLRSPTCVVSDFVFEDSADDLSKTSTNFDFGVYLEYWRRGRKNSVIPKYENLKQELTMNKYWSITIQQYNDLCTISIIIRRPLPHPVLRDLLSQGSFK